MAKSRTQMIADELVRFGRQAKQGGTFGFADEIQDLAGAGIAAAFTDMSYKDALAMARELSKQELSNDWEESPWVSGAGQVAGGIPLGFTRAGKAATDWIRAGSTLQGIGKGAAVGAGFGGAAGLGAADDTLSDRAFGLGGGAAIGAALGGVTAPLARLGISPDDVDYRKVTEKTAKGFDNKAQQELARQLAARPDLPDQLARAEGMSQAAQRSGIPLTLAETIAQSGSDPLLAQQAVLGSNPMTAGRMGQMYSARSGTPQQAGQIEQRLMALAQGLDPSVGSYDEAAGAIIQRAGQSQKDITANLSSKAAPLYDEAFSQPTSIMNQDLQRFIDTPEMKRGIGRGLNIQRLESIAKGEPFDPKVYGIVDFNEAGDPIIGSNINTRLLDAGKRGLDAMIQDETNQFGRVSDLGRVLTQFKNSYLSKIDDFNPTYAEARASYSGNPELLRLRDVAGGISSVDPTDTRALSRQLFSGTQQNADLAARALGDRAPTAAAARIYGAMDELRNDPVNIASRIAPDQRTSDMMRSYAGSQYQPIEETLNVINQAKLGERMRYGSPTQPRMQAEQGMSEAAGSALNVATDIKTGGATAVMRKVAQMLGRGNEQVDPQFYSDMADLMLTNQGMDLLRRVASGQQTAIQELQQVGLPSLITGSTARATTSLPVARAGIGGLMTPAQEKSPVFLDQKPSQELPPGFVKQENYLQELPAGFIIQK
jgi:hypothetical protein